VLTKECLFCGSLLIDMVDNDIITESNYEFYQEELAGGGILGNVEEDEWKIE